MAHVIRLGDGTRVPISVYVRAWKSMLTTDGDAIVPLDLNDAFTCRAPQRVEAAVLQFRRGMHARINRHLPWHNRGRKWSAEWWFPALRVAQYANNRISVLG
jgi:hypothetical protein